MPELTEADIRAHIAGLAVPPCGLGELAALAERLCIAQQTLTPVATPRRLVIFAADHGPGGESDVGQAIREVVFGGAATVVLAKATNSEFILVDVGSRSEAMRDTANYRCRKVRTGAHEFDQPALSADEFRAAFIVGQNEAERAAKEGIKLVATDALGRGSLAGAERVFSYLATDASRDSDLVAAFAGVGGADVAAAAGFVAKSAELGLTVLVCGRFAECAAAVAERLYAGTLARVVSHGPAPVPEGKGGGSEPSDGLGALLAFALLDTATAIVSLTSRRAFAHEQVVSVRRKKIAIFTGSFDPPSTFHRRVAKVLRDNGFDQVIVRPNGPRDGTDELEHASPIHRAVMADLAFRDLPGVSVDLSDLDDGVFTPPVAFDDLHADHGEVWHVVSDEFVAGGRNRQSAVHTKWECGEEMWANRRFIVLHPDGCAPEAPDLPPLCKLIAADGHVPTVDIRTRVFQGGTARRDVPEAVESYIRRYGLFSGKPSPRETRIRIAGLRLKLIYDKRNQKARDYAEAYRKYESSDPTHILVIGGDGTLLQAIRDYWRLRLPFIGLNAGTLGFLMNASLPADPEGTELVLYRMPMLRVDTEAPDGTRATTQASGDAWVERDTGQAAWLRIAVHGRTQVSRVSGDGLLVATPAGSNSYARAMGATPVPLTAPVLTLAGSNIFRPLFWRPITLPEETPVTITSLRHDLTPGYNDKRPIRGFADGQPCGKVLSMSIRVSSIAAVELGFTPEFDIAGRVLQSMIPPEEKH